MYIYICIIYHYALKNAKIELNERPSFTPSNWHSINTQFTDHVTAFRRRCLLIIRCLSISWLHACSVAKRTGLAGYPPGATLGVDPGLHHRCAHTGGWLATERQILADSEVERGNGLTIVTEGTQLPVSFWRFHYIAGMTALCHCSVWRYYDYPEISIHSLSEQGAHARYIAFYLFKSKENTRHMVRPVQGARICLNAKLWAHCYQ